jgi:hypothetical protein
VAGTIRSTIELGKLTLRSIQSASRPVALLGDGESDHGDPGVGEPGQQVVDLRRAVEDLAEDAGDPQPVRVPGLLGQHPVQAVLRGEPVADRRRSGR